MLIVVVRQPIRQQDEITVYNVLSLLIQICVLVQQTN